MAVQKRLDVLRMPPVVRVVVHDIVDELVDIRDGRAGRFQRSPEVLHRQTQLVFDVGREYSIGVAADLARCRYNSTCPCSRRRV